MSVSRQLVVAPTAHLRMQAALRWLKERAPQEPLRIVAPGELGAAALLREHGAAGWAAAGWSRTSLQRWIRRLAHEELDVREVVPASVLVLEAMCTQLVAQARAAGELGPWEPLAAGPGLAKALRRTCGDTRLLGVSAASLPEPLATLRARYDAMLQEGGWADAATLWEAATQVVMRPHHQRVPTLGLDLTLRHPLEQRFWRAVLDQETTALITATPELAASWRQLLALEPTLPAVPPPVTRLARLQRELFAEGAASEPPPPDKTVEIFSAPGEAPECVEIVRRIHHLAEGGVPFERMAVLLRDPQRYLAPLSDALTRGDVPAYFEPGLRRPHGGGRALLALLRCAQEDLSVPRLLEYLSLDELPMPSAPAVTWDDDPDQDDWDTWEDAEEEEPAPAEPPPGWNLQAWEDLVIEARIYRGRARWQRRLGEVRRRAQTMASAADEKQRARAQRRLERLDALEGAVLPLLDHLSTLPRAARWEVWLQQLEALATMALRRPGGTLAVLRDLAPLGPLGPVSLSEVIATLQPALTHVQHPSGPYPGGQVMITTLDDAAGACFAAVFVPGLAEGIFPPKLTEDPLWSQRERSTARLEEERYRLRLACGAATERIVFSYPRLQPELSRPRVSSFYLLEILRAAEGHLPHHRELARRAEAAAAMRGRWRAPLDPHRAIDDAELDLAVLAPLLRSAAPPVGKARYLTEVNPHLGRALRARARRWHPSWTPADGLYKIAPAAQEILSRHSLTARAYSPTSLQRFAKCPYQFYLHSVMGLRARDTPEQPQVLDALQRGSLVHDVLFRLLSRRTHTSGLHAELDAVFDDVAQAWEEEVFPALVKQSRQSLLALREDLHAVVEQLVADPTWRPRFFELSFGLDHLERDADPASRSEAVALEEGFLVCGSMDLVEEDPQGALRVTDYKTGRLWGPLQGTLAGGTRLQPLIYALALEAGWERQVVGGRLLYCSREGERAVVEVPLTAETREAAFKALRAVEHAIQHAQLPAAPVEHACRYCDFLPICGPHQEARAARKPLEHLHNLKVLREQS